MEQNIVIPIFYDKENRKTYVINPASRRIYWHKYRHKYQSFNINTNFVAGFSVLFVTAIVPMMRNWLASQGLDNLSESIRILLVFIGVAIGILAFVIGRKKRHFIMFEDFLVKHPEVEEMNNVTDIEKLLHDVSTRVSMMIAVPVWTGLIGTLLFILFFYNSNLLVYGWGVGFTLAAGFTSVFYNDIVFLSKLKEVDDISYTKANEVKLDEEVNREEPELVNKNDCVTKGAANIIDWDKLSR